MRLLAATFGLIIVAIGALGVAGPAVLLELGRTLQTPSALYVVAAIRIVFGAVLLAVASGSRMPRTLRVLGIVIIIAGLLTPFFGVERTQAVLRWWSSQDPLLVRALAGVAIVFGIFIIHVVRRPRRGDGAAVV